MGDCLKKMTWEQSTCQKNIEHKYELEFKCIIAYPSTRVATVGARFQDHEKRPHSSDRHICKHRSHQNSFKHHLVIDPPYALWKSMVCGVMVSLLRRQWSITWRQTGILRGTYALSSFLLSTPGVTPPSQRNFAHSWMWDRPVTCMRTHRPRWLAHREEGSSPIRHCATPPYTPPNCPPPHSMPWLCQL